MAKYTYTVSFRGRKIGESCLRYLITDKFQSNAEIDGPKYIQYFNGYPSLFDKYEFITAVRLVDIEFNENAPEEELKTKGAKRS